MIRVSLLLLALLIPAINLFVPAYQLDEQDLTLIRQKKKMGGAAHPSVPILLQHSDESYTWGYTDTSHSSPNDKTYIAALPQQTHVGNIVIINFTVNKSTAPTGIAVSDDGGNSYTLLSSIGSSTNGQWLGQWCGVQNSQAQIFTMSATTDLGGTFTKETASEYAGVATGAGGCASADQNWTHDNTTASTSVTSGTTTKSPSVSGDLIHTFFVNDNGQNTSFTVGSQSNITWKLLPGTGNIWEGIGQQWGVYNSTTAFNPTQTVAPASQYIASAIALKAATAGTAAPASMWVSGIQHSAIFNSANGSSVFLGNQTSPVNFQFPTTGNLGVITFTGDFNGYPTAISSSVGGETWSQQERLNDNANDGFAAIWAACNIAPSNSRILTITLNQSVPAGSGVTAIFYDVSNAIASSSCFDAGGTPNGVQSSVTSSFTYSVGTFGAANELMISTVSLQASVAAFESFANNINSNHGGFTLATATPENQCDISINPPQPVDECNGMFTSLVSSTASFNITVTRATNGTQGAAFGDWVAAWAAFKHP